MMHRGKCEPVRMLKRSIKLKNSAITLLLLGTCLALLQPAAGYANCTIKWSDPLPSWFPLVFNSSGIIYPQRTGNNNDWKIVVRRYSKFNLGCSDTTNNVNGYTSSELDVKCNTNGLAVNRNVVNFTQLGCSKQVKEKVVVVGSCYNESTAADILFQSNSTQFPLINVCHNTNRDETIHVHHYIIGAGLNPYEVSNNRPSFKEGQFYTTISANDAYTQSSQRNQVGYLVGSQSLAEKYINTSRSFYFARGHLAPDGDFVHIYEQNATYYYINVAPQWQSINNGNWKALESALRTYAKSKNTNLEVWTGGKDVLKLDDVNGNPVEIYLARDSKGKLSLPAPELSWKVLQDPTRNASVAVFMVNNPHLTQIPSRLILCPDVCSQISWVTWDVKNIEKGYTYCCKMDSVPSILPYIPDMKNVQLLT